MLATSAHLTTVLSAAENQQGGGSMLTMLLPLVLIGVVFYFLILRPQKKQRQQASEMQSQLVPGSEVMVSGGIYATVRSLEDDKAEVEISPGVTMTIARQAIVRVVQPEVPDSPAGLADTDADSSSESDSDTSAEGKDGAKGKDAPTAEWPDEGSKN